MVSGRNGHTTFAYSAFWNGAYDGFHLDRGPRLCQLFLHPLTILSSHLLEFSRKSRKELENNSGFDKIRCDADGIYHLWSVNDPIVLHSTFIQQCSAFMRLLRESNGMVNCFFLLESDFRPI
jgi:hypothetical protein